MRSIPRRARSERPGPRRPQPTSPAAQNLRRRITVHWTASRRVHQTRERIARTFWAGGWRRPCVRRPSCYVTQFWQLARGQHRRRRRPRRGATAAARSIQARAGRRRSPRTAHAWGLLRRSLFLGDPLLSANNLKWAGQFECSVVNNTFV